MSYRPARAQTQTVRAKELSELILLGLGSNRGGVWGCPADMIIRCVKELTDLAFFSVQRKSSLYQTAGVGPGRSGVFVNAAVVGDSHLSPEALLRALKRIERGAGSRSAMPWGPRALDIDILAYKNRVIGWPGLGRNSRQRRKAGPPLTIPHPGMHVRPFVLVPLLEICPEWRHPVLELSVRQFCHRAASATQGKVLQRIDNTSLRNRTGDACLDS